MNICPIALHTRIFSCLTLCEEVAFEQIHRRQQTLLEQNTHWALCPWVSTLRQRAVLTRNVLEK